MDTWLSFLLLDPVLFAYLVSIGIAITTSSIWFFWFWFFQFPPRDIPAGNHGSCVHHLFYEYNDHDSLQPTMFSLLHISRDARLTAFFSTLKNRKENKQKKKIDVSLNFQKRDSQDVTIFHFQNLHCKSYPPDPQHVMESRAFFMFKLQ